jgi:hypothetical protein
MGYKVAVYGDFKEEFLKSNVLEENKVHYYSFIDFRCTTKYNILILWRNYGFFPLINYNLIANKILYDIHDSQSMIDDNNYDKISKIMLKSNFHKIIISNQKKHLNLNSIYVVENGVRTQEFETPPNPKPKRDLYRMCYCSCYTRGLEQILENLFPVLKKLEPRMTLHVYYGMNSVKDEVFKQKMNKLLNQDGIVDHGRQSAYEIKVEKYTSTFHLYYTTTQSETDCISIRESICAGCIPILSKYNVFSERKGIHLNGNPTKKEDMINAAKTIYEIINDSKKIELLQKQISECKENNWNDIANIWKNNAF